MWRILLAFGASIGLIIILMVIVFAFIDGLKLRLAVPAPLRRECRPTAHSWYVPDNGNQAVCRKCDQPGPLVIPTFMDPLDVDSHFLRQQWNDAQPAPKDFA